MNPSNHTEALARVYAAAATSAAQVVLSGKAARDFTVAGAAQASVRDFVTLINTLEDEERERVGSREA